MLQLNTRSLSPANRHSVTHQTKSTNKATVLNHPFTSEVLQNSPSPITLQKGQAPTGTLVPPSLSSSQHHLPSPPHPAAAPRCVLDGPQGPQADHALRRALRHLLSQTSAGAGRVGASSSPFHLTRGATGPKRANREGPEKAERHQKKSIDSFLAKMAGEERKLLESMRSCGFSVQDVLHAYWVPPVHAGFSLQTWTLGY